MSLDHHSACTFRGVPVKLLGGTRIAIEDGHEARVGAIVGAPGCNRQKSIWFVAQAPTLDAIDFRPCLDAFMAEIRIAHEEVTAPIHVHRWDHHAWSAYEDDGEMMPAGEARHCWCGAYEVLR